MIYKNGYWWPDCITDKDVDFANNMLVYANAMLPFCKRRDLILQAGGCVGLYPIAQSHHFKTVYTFEPDRENFACLSKNILGYDNVFAFNCALAQANQPVYLKKVKYATHRIAYDDKPNIAGVSIDSFLSHCTLVPDAIQIDVEGFEYQVLLGAINTIEKYRPVIQLEELKTDDGRAGNLLLSMGYTAGMKRGKDRIYIP